MLRRGLKHILAEEFKRAAFSEARNAQESFDLVGKEHWEVIVLDITMPERSGLEVRREIRKLRLTPGPGAYKSTRRTSLCLGLL